MSAQSAIMSRSTLISSPQFTVKAFAGGQCGLTGRFFPVGLPAAICRGQRCSTYRVASANVVVVRRRKVENDFGRRVERHVGTCADVEAAAGAPAAGAASAG